MSLLQCQALLLLSFSSAGRERPTLSPASEAPTLALSESLHSSPTSWKSLIWHTSMGVSSVVNHSAFTSPAIWDQRGGQKGRMHVRVFRHSRNHWETQQRKKTASQYRSCAEVFMEDQTLKTHTHSYTYTHTYTRMRTHTPHSSQCLSPAVSQVSQFQLKFSAISGDGVKLAGGSLVGFVD